MCRICDRQEAHIETIGGWICEHCRWIYFNNLLPTRFTVLSGIELEYEGGNYVSAICNIKALNSRDKTLLWKVGFDSGLLLGGIEVSTIPFHSSRTPELKETLNVIKQAGFQVRNRCSMHVNFPSTKTYFYRYYLTMVKWEEYLACLRNEQRLKFFSVKQLFKEFKDFENYYLTQDAYNPRSGLRYFVLNTHALIERKCIEHRYFSSEFKIANIWANIIFARELEQAIRTNRISFFTSFWDFFDSVPLPVSQRQRLKRVIKSGSPGFLTPIDFETWDIRRRWGNGTQ